VNVDVPAAVTMVVAKVAAIRQRAAVAAARGDEGSEIDCENREHEETPEHGGDLRAAPLISKDSAARRWNPLGTR
jgi:hypothetical protein